MSSPESGNQGDTAPTSNEGLPVSYGALISDPGPPYVYQWGNETGDGVNLTFSFPGATAAWATVLTYSDSNEPETDAPLFEIEMEAARSALLAWSSVANISFTEVTETATDVGQIRFAWTQASNGSASAWAYFPDEYWASGSDVWLSLSAPNMVASRGVDSEWLAGGGAYQTLLHEIGHALGLVHPFDGLVTLPPQENTHQYTLMAYETHPNSLFRQVIDNGGGNYSIEFATILPDTPMLFDILAIQYLYDANLGYHAEPDLYSFGPATPFIRTLWDAGGTDTISVSDFTLGCRIDLRPGTFSSLTILSDPLPPGYFSDTVPTYDGTNNLAIAFDCWIENAIGGSGHDIITGNILDNGITGGLGVDTAIYAGATVGYLITRVGAGWTVTDTNLDDGNDGTDSLTGIEWLQFTDGLQRLGMTASDHNGDGKSDILLHNTNAGMVATWQINGTTITGGGTPGSLGADWTIADGSSDYNGDGMGDVLLRHTSTGLVAEWLLNGSTISGAGTPGNLGAGWTIG